MSWLTIFIYGIVMSIFSLSMLPISRRKQPSIIKYIASLSGTKMFDNRQQKQFDYTKRTGVVSNRLHLPGCMILSDLSLTPETIWNFADAVEVRCNSRVAREIRVIVPFEITQESQKVRLLNTFAKLLCDNYQIAIQVILNLPHEHNDQRVYHAHLLLTTREVRLDGQYKITFGNKSILEWSGTQLKMAGLIASKDELKRIRQLWSDCVNLYLKQVGSNVRIDSRSNAEQGLEILPKLRLTPYEMLLERQGVTTLKGDYNRNLMVLNETILTAETIHEKQTTAALEITDSFIETYHTLAEATDRRIIKFNKFTARAYQTDKFIEKYHHQTTATDNAIVNLMRAVAK